MYFRKNDEIETKSLPLLERKIFKNLEQFAQDLNPDMDF